ncbi:hypothetical protein JTB14_005218 [Gonioctena quinquepunctata]|nr:hypothetical protein JTB14_005218 [Gonioctena quinquepunctata]
MGKKRRLNRFISKWIKSDLPADRSTVLLLGVTRIPTSPVAVRRPCPLSLTPAAAAGGRLQRRNSSGAGKKAGQIVRRNSSRKADGKRHQQVPVVEIVASVCETPTPTPSPSSERCGDRSSSSANLPPSRSVPTSFDAMERSVDSIGTCSLDVDASAELSG